MRRSGGNGRLRWRLLPRRRRGWLWLALSMGIVLNGLRLRRRLAGLHVVDSSRHDQPTSDDDDFVVFHLPEVKVDAATRRAAIAHARIEGLDVVDLVPGDLPLAQALDLGRVLDTTTFRSAPLVVGRGALHAVVVRRAVWERMAPETDAAGGVDQVAGTVRDRAAFVRLSVRLKQYAARSSDLAVAPGLGAVDASIEERLGRLEALYSGAYPIALAIPAVRSSLLLAGLVLSPGWGAAAAAGFLLQPYLVTAGTGLNPSQGPSAAIGTLAEPFALIRGALAGRARGRRAGGPPAEDPVEALRPAYRAALAQGTARFFEPRRTTCPWCGSPALAECFRTTDLYQFKPGEFVMEECTSCGLFFQNPRLSIEGLDFYYRDFYDGLGAGQMQFLFSQSEPGYLQRAEMAQRHVSPRAWLDVGTGYGHFCLVARGLLTETRFDGLDMGNGVEEGQRRRWLDHSYRGLFPDLADDLKGRYDLVSMHHYLEHTRDPRLELDAAHAVLEPGGHLLIEVPDPECRFGRLYGRFWVPWLQPQHQQLVPVGKLCAALEDRGFSIVEVERGPANPAFDLAGAMWMWSAATAPPGRLPWRDDPTPAERIERWLVLGAMAPFAVVGMALAAGAQQLMTNKGEPWANAYRVLARRD